MASKKRITALVVVLAMSLGLLTACASNPLVVVEEAMEVPAPATTVVRVDGPQGVLLAYYQQVQRMSAAELVKERSHLASLVATPAIQMRQAMVLGQPRFPIDLGRALGLLDVVLKLTNPSAVDLHPLARLLAEQYSERLKLEMQLDKVNQQLKDSQRRADELQEKLNALADIERSLPPPPRAVRPAAPGVGR